MSASLVILCLASFVITAALVSGLVAVALPWLELVSAKLSAPKRTRYWLGLAVLPTVVAALTVGASFLPAMGIGLDHCLAHLPHHPHLCPHHVGAPPGIVLVLLALLFVVRLLQVLTAVLRGLRQSRDTAATLSQASEHYRDALVFPSDEPQAFVLGVLRPRIHLSRGLLALGADIVEPILAHERAHAAGRDLLWRALYPVVAAGHLPSTTEELRSRFYAAQEMAADAEAADALVDGRLKIAEALLSLARLPLRPSPGLSFIHGDIKARVHALLERRTPHSAWLARVLTLFAVLVPAAVAALSEPIHHLLETVLGALS